MKSVLTAAALLLSTCSFQPAMASWALDRMNAQIEQTNFIVGRGCSGTLISPTHILTNYHCIDGDVEAVEREVTDKDGFVKKVKQRRYRDVTLEQHQYDGFARTGTASYVSEIVAEDQKRDLALLKVKSKLPNSMFSKLGGDVLRGELTYAVGNPAGQYATVVAGIVSSVNRTFEFPWTQGEKLAMIQFSGGLYGGNSGGALYNDKGELVGVPAAGFPAATFIGLAIPVSVVKSFIKDNCLASIYDTTADDAACRVVKAKKDKKDD